MVSLDINYAILCIDFSCIQIVFAGGSENKNFAVFVLAGLLVHLGIVDEIILCRLPVGYYCII